jgi:hypothetical protein
LIKKTKTKVWRRLMVVVFVDVKGRKRKGGEEGRQGWEE